MNPITSSVVHLTHLVLKLGPNDTGSTFEWVGSEAGADGNPLPPPNCAALVKKITGLGGRKQRGRAYLPGCSRPGNSLTTAGTFDASDAEAIGDAVFAFLADLASTPSGTEADGVLLHSDSTPPTPITATICEPKLATQRRRLRA